MYEKKSIDMSPYLWLQVTISPVTLKKRVEQEEQSKSDFKKQWMLLVQFMCSLFFCIVFDGMEDIYERILI